MRIFIGIKLNQPVHDQLEHFLKPFKKISTPIQWVKQENIHLTLKFIGEVSEPKVQQISDALAHLEKFEQPLNIQLTGCGKFGRNDDLNIFWIGLAANPALLKLYSNIEEALAKLSIPRETRPFTPHLTVGRNKKMFNFKALLKHIEELANVPIATFSTGHFQLFKSDLRPTGPIYTILKEIPITHGQA